MEYCCEMCANGYVDCKKCYEADDIQKHLDSEIYAKFVKGEKLSAEEIEALKMEVEDIRKNLNTL